MAQHLSEITEHAGVILDPVALGTGSNNTAGVDVAEHQGILFSVPITDVLDTSVITVTLSDSPDNSVWTVRAAVVTVTSGADDDLNDKVLLLDVRRPVQRWCRVEVLVATANAATGDVTAILYGHRNAPETGEAGVAARATADSPQ